MGSTQSFDYSSTFNRISIQKKSRHLIKHREIKTKVQLIEETTNDYVVCRYELTKYLGVDHTLKCRKARKPKQCSDSDMFDVYRLGAHSRRIPELFSVLEKSLLDNSYNNLCCNTPKTISLNSSEKKILSQQKLRRKSAPKLVSCGSCHVQIEFVHSAVLVPCGHVICRNCIEYKISKHFRPGGGGPVLCTCPSIGCNDSVQHWTLVDTGCPIFDCNPTLTSAPLMLNRQERFNNQLNESLIDLSIHTDTVSGNSELPTCSNQPEPSDIPAPKEIQLSQEILYRVNTLHQKKFDHSLQWTETNESTVATRNLISITAAAFTPSKHSLKPDARNSANCLPCNIDCYAIVSTQGATSIQEELITSGATS